MKQKIRLMVVFVLLIISSSICEAKIIINKQPKSQHSRISGEVEFTVDATGKNIRYQWYYSQDKKKTWHKLKYQTSRSMIVRCNKSNRGYYYGCRMKDAYGKYKTTKPVRVYITDIGKKYSYSIDKGNIKNLFYPKAADGYCYIYCHDRTYEQQVIDSIKIINKNVGTTFIYTRTGCIADITIFDFYDNYVEENLWFKQAEKFHINQNGDRWAGVTFNEDGVCYLVGLNNRYFNYVIDDAIRAVIIHELGHCIGINHSTNENDIMYHISRSDDKMSKNDIKKFKLQRKKIRNIGSVDAITKVSGITDYIEKKHIFDYEDQTRGR